MDYEDTIPIIGSIITAIYVIIGIINDLSQWSTIHVISFVIVGFCIFIIFYDGA